MSLILSIICDFCRETVSTPYTNSKALDYAEKTKGKKHVCDSCAAKLQEANSK